MLALAPIFAASLVVLADGAQTFDVSVGDRGLTFSPPFIKAVKGDKVNFAFHPKAHSVTQSTFDKPCTPLDGGYDTDLVPVAAGAEPIVKTFTVQDDTKPIWMFCKQPGNPPAIPAHCGAGMVFAINPDNSGDKTFEAFQGLAKASASNSSITSNAPSATESSTSVAEPSFTTVTVTVTATKPDESTLQTWTTTYGSYSGVPDPTPTAAPATHTIRVGEKGTLSYNPANIMAAVGDKVKFVFTSKNHTATRTSFSQPCSPLTDDDAFDSGFKPSINLTEADFPTFDITVKDQKPIWIACMKDKHCSAGPMVAAINAPLDGSNTFDAFKALATKQQGAGAPSSSDSGSTTGSATASSPSASSTGNSAMHQMPVSALMSGIVAAALAALL